MITIDKATAAKLDKFAEMRARVERLLAAGNEVAACDLYTPEVRALKQDLIEEFLPLVNRLVEAGLIAVQMGFSEEDRASVGAGTLMGDATVAYDNGLIYVHADGISGYPCRDQPLAAGSDE